MKLISEAYSASTPYWLRKEFNAFPVLKSILLQKYERGLDAINFVEYPVPTSPRDSIKDLSLGRMVFLRLVGKSSIRTSSDAGVLVLDPPSQTGRKLWQAQIFPEDFSVLDKNNNYVRVKDYISNSITNWSLLFNNCTAICYIDTADNSDSIKSKRAERLKTTDYATSEPHAYSNDIHPEIRYGDPAQASIMTDVNRGYSKWQDVKGFDKSGYAMMSIDSLKRELIKKYPNILRDSRIKKLVAELEEHRKAILSASSKVKKLFLNSEELNDFDFERFFRILTYAKEEYDILCQQIVIDNPQNAFNSNELNDLRRYVKKIEEMINVALKPDTLFVDWDNDDMWLDDEEDED